MRVGSSCKEVECDSFRQKLCSLKQPQDSLRYPMGYGSLRYNLCHCVKSIVCIFRLQNITEKATIFKCFVSSLISYKLPKEPVQIQNTYFNTKYSYIQSITALLKDATALNFDVWRHRGLAKASGCFLYKQTYLILLLHIIKKMIHTCAKNNKNYSHIFENV
jgi:hypothetical protein